MSWFWEKLVADQRMEWQVSINMTLLLIGGSNKYFQKNLSTTESETQ